MKNKEENKNYWYNKGYVAALNKLYDDSISAITRSKMENLFMTDIAQEVVQAAETIAPTAPVVQVAEAAITTVADPSPANILADLELALSLVKQFKASLSGVHPSIMALIKAIF